MNMFKGLSKLYGDMKLRIRSLHIIVGILLLTGLFTAFLSTGCSDDNGLGEDFEGITKTDYYGNVLSIDVDDWCGTLTPRYLFLEPEDCKILMPCSTLGDSVIDSFSVFNEWIYDIITRVSATDTNLTVTPDSVIIPAQDSVTFEVKFKLLDNLNHNGNITFTQFEPTASTSVNFNAGFNVLDIPCARTNVPDQYYFFPAYPNPADVGTIIEYALPRTSDVNISIYTPEENFVTTLVDDTLPAGYYQVYWNVRDITPDIYDCRMEAGDYECRGNIQVE